MFNFGVGKNNNGDNQKEKKKGDPQLRGNPIVWILVAIYLIYTSWKLVSDISAAGIDSKNWYFLIFVVIFAGFAVFLLLRSAKQLKAMKDKSDREVDEIEREEREEQELRAKFSPTPDEERFFREMNEIRKENERKKALSEEASGEETEEDAEEDAEEEPEEDEPEN